MPSRLAVAPVRLGAAPRSEADRSRQRKILSPWRAWYNTARWADLRWSVLVDANFRCAICGAEHSRLTAQCEALVVVGRLDVMLADRLRGTGFIADHVIPHRGDPDLFWARSNLQCLCKPCHDRVKQAEERRGDVG